MGINVETQLAVEDNHTFWHGTYLGEVGAPGYGLLRSETKEGSLRQSGQVWKNG